MTSIRSARFAGLGPGRGQQARPLTRTEAQRAGQQPDGVEPRVRSGSRSRSLTALALTPARSASASWVRPAASRRCRSSSPNDGHGTKTGSIRGALVLSPGRAGAQAGRHVTGRPEVPRAPPGRGGPQPGRSRGRQRAHVPHLHSPRSRRRARARPGEPAGLAVPYPSDLSRLPRHRGRRVRRGGARGPADHRLRYARRHRPARSSSPSCRSPGPVPTAGSPSTGARPTCSPCWASSVPRSRRCGR